MSPIDSRISNKLMLPASLRPRLWACPQLPSPFEGFPFTLSKRWSTPYCYKINVTWATSPKAFTVGVWIDVSVTSLEPKKTHLAYQLVCVLFPIWICFRIDFHQLLWSQAYAWSHYLAQISHFPKTQVPKKNLMYTLKSMELTQWCTQRIHLRLKETRK